TANNMPFKPEISYDPVNKIWTGALETDHFAPDLSIGEIIFREMRRHPKQVAQISVTENTVLTREELLENSMRIASFFRNLGLRQSDIVGIVATNSTHIASIAYACFFNGIAFHALDLQNLEQIEQFAITKPKVIFCDSDIYENVRGATQELSVKIITMDNRSMGRTSIEEVLHTQVEDNFKPARLEQGNHQTLAILCTSGTTSTPKVVTISNSRKILNACLMLTTQDVMYTHSMLAWLSGLRAIVASGVLSATRIIDARKVFDPKLTLRLIEQYKVTWVYFPPAYLTKIVNCTEFEHANLDSLRYIMYSSERCSLDVQSRVRHRLQRDILHHGYGLSEAGSWASVNWNFDEKPNSVGRLTAGYKLKILNEKNDALGPNENGEVCLRYGDYWGGYYGNVEESNNFRDSGLWFHTGDIGYMDVDGFLYIVGRKKDMLRYQCVDYIPNDIEKVISQMPQVASVCVFGIWNRFNGDEAGACVVKKPGCQLTEVEVVDYVDRHSNNNNKKLHSGALIVDDLKRSGMGKTNRNGNKMHFMEVKGLR
ncbi:hypothetical protein KR222_009686, partial [Zaprionus bogoriensis]